MVDHRYDPNGRESRQYRGDVRDFSALKAAFDQEMDGYREQCVTSAAMYPDWFDMPEGKEGGAAFLGKRPPEFWDIRRREAEARAQLLADYESRHGK